MAISYDIDVTHGRSYGDDERNMVMVVDGGLQHHSDAIHHK
jgi:hypothetical protein